MGEQKQQGHADTPAPAQPTSALEAWQAGIAAHHAATAPVVDSRIPGVAPDVKAIDPWVDTVPATQSPAKPSPAKPASRNEQLVDMQATAHAAALSLTRHTTNDPGKRWQFLNTLDRIDDPVVRAKTLEQFQAQTGMPLQLFINSTEWHSDRDQEQALALISPERGAAERELQGLSPEKRKKLTADANGWANEVLHATRPDDAALDDKSQNLSNVLGKRTPVEIEAIRASVRYNTRDKSLYQEIDRSQSGGNEDEALAGTTGNRVFAASVGITNADGNAERIKEIVGGLSVAERAGLVLSNGPLGASAITSAVHESQRGEVQKLLAGNDAAADGAHFADLFKDPKAGLQMNGIELTQQSQQNFDARQPENVIKELRSKGPEAIAKARSAWDTDPANRGRSWDQMIQERFGSGDPTTFLRISALAHGNKVEERAYALRDGIRKNNQAQIEAELANPDLTSPDPKKVAAAEAEKQQLQARVRELDALGQRTTATMMGQDPAQAAGRDLDAQLEDHYKDAVAKNPHTTDPAELLVLSADPEGSKVKRQVRAGEDKYATDELKTEGKLSATTEIRRAETKGDTKRKAELLENLPTGSDLTTVKTEFQKRYNKDPLAEPDLAEIDSTSAFLKSTGDSRPLSEIKASVADKMQSSLELRVQDVHDYGVKAERPAFLQHALQKRVYAKQYSESHEDSEALRARYGLNVGTVDLAKAQIANQDDMFTEPTGPYGTGTRELKVGVDREQFMRGDKALTKSLDLQREEKIKHAERLANTFVTIAKIGAILIAQPELVMLIDVAANLGGMAIKQSAGGSDVDVSTDMATTMVDVIADGLGVGVVRAGARTALNTERAVQAGERTAQELAEHGVTTEAKSEIVGAGAKAAAGESSVLSKELAAVSETGVEGGAAQLAKAETGALALAEGKLANEGVSAGTSTVSHGGMVANMGVNSFGSVLGGAVHGESSDDILIGLTRMLAGALLPGRLAGSMQKAIGTGSKWQRGLGTLIGAGADVGTSAAISGSVVDAVGNRVQHHVGGHSNPHADDDRYARRTSHDTDAFAHHADDAVQPAARHVDATDGPDASTRLPHDGEPALSLHGEAHASEHDESSQRAHRSRHLDPAQRADAEEHIRKHGHTGVDLHSHFLGIASTEDFAKQMGGAKPLSNEEMLAKMHTAVRKDPDYAKHYSRDDQGTQIFDHSGAGKGGKGGDAFENVKAIEVAQAKLNELPKPGLRTPEQEARARELSETAVRQAMETTQGTPYDGAYSIRDTLVKEYIDPQGKTKSPYANYTKMALAALERDGVRYSEQSQSVGKLSKGNFPEALTQQALAEINADRAKRGESPMDVRFLAMLNTKFLGEQGSDTAGSAKEWSDELKVAREVMNRGDVIGLDFASPETSTMAKGGEQLRQRFREAATMLKEVGAERGRKLVLRPHVGEGYVEMPIDPKTGKPMDHDRDNNREHYKKAQDNMRALVDAVAAMTKPGANGEAPLYDPKNPAFEIRFGHSTHASPEIAADMARLGIIAEVNLNSNAISGSLQDNRSNPVGRDADGRLQSFADHSLLALAGEGVPIVLSTDGQAVMNTSLAKEYERARSILAAFRGDAASGEHGKGTMPVSREAFLRAHPHLSPESVAPPFQLEYNELPGDMKQNIDTAFERMLAEASNRRANVVADDQMDLSRNTSTAVRP